MKKLVTMIALGLFMAGGVYAQDAPQQVKKHTEHRGKRGVRPQSIKPEERAARQTEILSRKLGLNESQKNQLHVLNMKRAQELQALNGKYDKADTRNEARRSEQKAIQERYQAELKKVLDGKQYAQLEADRKAKRERFKKVENERVKNKKMNKVQREKQNN